LRILIAVNRRNQAGCVQNFMVQEIRGCPAAALGRAKGWGFAAKPEKTKLMLSAAGRAAIVAALKMGSAAKKAGSAKNTRGKAA
jgi:hypothetical protein